MKILLLIILYLISGPVDCIDVNGYSGGSVTIISDIQWNKHNKKLFLVLIRKLKPQDAGMYRLGVGYQSNATVNLKVHNSTSFGLPKIISAYLGQNITITCNYPVEEMWLHVTELITNIHPTTTATYLMTSAALTETPSAVCFCSPFIIISVCVCVTLLLIGGCTLMMIYKLRQKRAQYNMPSIKSKENKQLSPVYNPYSASEF
ncbi:hypothetical protein KOW79_013395 [Hemibagrus wyckioides]|uniref:Uncharacterized protein n=1 Tax=Hemibagrus wyckioides TaxID=337641 RepID=A0A9D3NIS7_9TELE|nr:hypothetical protein KOW79_013395 [Hemibagrus wyckioides]